MKQCLVYVFRHGETDWNRDGRLQGHCDIPLNENGKAQACDLAKKLAFSRVQAVLSSDLTRALQTATMVASVLRIPVYATSALREINGGDVEGLTGKEIAERLGEEFVAKMRSVRSADIDARYPTGESKSELVIRCRTAIAQFIASNDYSRIGVATPGGVLRHLAHSCISDEREAISIPNCAVYCFRLEPHACRLEFAGPYQPGYCTNQL